MPCMLEKLDIPYMLEKFDIPGMLEKFDTAYIILTFLNIKHTTIFYQRSAPLQYGTYFITYVSLR